MASRSFDQVNDDSPPPFDFSGLPYTISSSCPQKHHSPSQEQYSQLSTSLAPSRSSSSDSKWKHKNTTIMNPCATSFAPKPTYASTLKASLPRPSGSSGNTPAARCSSGKQAANQPKGVSRDKEPQVGYSVHHDRESSTRTEPEASKVDDHAQVPPTDGLPNPTIRVSCEDGGLSTPVFFNPHLRHLHKGQGSRYSEATLNLWTFDSPHLSFRSRGLQGSCSRPGSRGHVEDAYNMYGRSKSSGSPDGSPYGIDGGSLQNPLYPGFHHSQPVVHNAPYLDPSVFGHGSRPASAYNTGGAFHRPPWPTDLIPPPMRNRLNLQYFYPPPPLMPYPTPYPYGACPIAHSSFAPPASTTPDIPTGPAPERGHYSRSSPRPASRGGGRIRARWRVSREGSRGRPHRVVGQHSRNTSGANRAHLGGRVESVPRPSPSPAPDAACERPAAPSALQVRGRSRYRIVSTTAGNNQSSRNDQTESTPGTGPEAGSESDSALTFASAENAGENHKRRTSGPRSHDERDIALKLQQTPFNEPPPNAPIAPASLRRLANATKGNPQTSLSHKPSELGSWSQSKRWISQETKERAAFQKLMHTLHYMGADKSPFLPRTPASLTEFRVAQTERKSRKLTQELRRKVEQLNSRNREEAITGPRPKLELFAGKTLADELSPVFAVDSCFNKTLPSGGQRVEWPSLAELKEEGDKRAARYGRCFPLPRLNQVACRVLELENAKAYNTGGSISWEKKAVKVVPRFIRTISPEVESEPCSQLQPQIQELHRHLQALLEEIDETDSED